MNLNIKKLNQSLNVPRTDLNISDNSTILKTMKGLKHIDETTNKSHSIFSDSQFIYNALNDQLIEKDKKSLMFFTQKIFIFVFKREYVFNYN